MKPTPRHISLFFLRIALGGLFLYAGISKILDPSWTAKSFLNAAQTFHGFYTWLASPALLPVIDFVNEWALALLGLSLLLGIFVRLSSTLGAVLMLLYYFPGLSFPYIPVPARVIVLLYNTPVKAPYSRFYPNLVNLDLDNHEPYANYDDNYS